MLKFQNNNTTLIATFKDFILTVYVVIDDLYHQFAPPEAISRRHVIVIRKGFLSILLYDSFKDFIIMDRPNFAFTAFIFWLYSIYIYFMGSDPINSIQASFPINSFPMINACAKPSGLGCTAYDKLIPKCFPSPNSS